jgi:ABC-type sugar transport system permease subunit
MKVMKKGCLTDPQFALLIVVGVIAFHALIVGVPLVYSFYLSFQDYNAILRASEYIGWDNYTTVLTDPEVMHSTWVTLEFAALSVAGTLVLAMAMALVLNEEFPGRGLLRALVLMPWAVSEVVSATMFTMLLNQTFGVLNGVLTPIGLAAPTTVWLDETWAVFWVAVTFVWHTAPLGTFFLLAALQTIPPDLYRAARIDRAGLWSRFRHVTLPHIKYAVLIVLVVVTVEAFREFDTLFSMTLGGPGTATLTLPLLIFRYNFQFSKYGLAAAASVILIAISTVLSIVYFLLLRTRKRRVAQVAVAAVVALEEARA